MEMMDEIEEEQSQLYKNMYNYSIQLLARRDYSAFELEQKLEVKFGKYDELTLQVLSKLQSEGYQNDLRFAEAYVRFRAHKNFGPIRIRQELEAKGVDSDTTTLAITAFENEASWSETLLNVWQKKFTEYPQNWQDRAKQSAFLLRRGFTREQIDHLFDKG